MHRSRSIWNENDSSRQRVKRCLGLNTHLQRLVLIAFSCVLPYHCLFVCFYLDIFFRMTRTVSYLVMVTKWIDLDKMIYIKSQGGRN